MNHPSTVTLPGPQDSPRSAFIDLLRGISIVGVVGVHFGGSFVSPGNAWTPSFYVGLAINQLASFAVPLFIFLSGLLGGSRDHHASAPSVGSFYLRRWTRIVVPYLWASAGAFYFLNIWPEWQALAGVREKSIWLVQRLGFYGVQPTLYFIPVILHLYLLQPILLRLPRWLNRLLPARVAPRWPEKRTTWILFALLFVLHLVLGSLCFADRLNYYNWARPNFLFWVFYFFAGLHFRVLITPLSLRGLRILLGGSFAVAVGSMIWNSIRLTTPSIVGVRFETSGIDYAYVRPVIMLFNLGTVTALAVCIKQGWSAPRTIFDYLGRYTLEIYLWHLIVLYYGVWRYPDALTWCRELPDLIPVICLACSLVIALVTDGTRRAVRFVSEHRVVVIRKPA